MALKLFSLNTWLLPFPFSIHNGKRTKDMIDMIRTYDPDVVCLQEVWLKSALYTFLRELPQYKSAYIIHKPSAIFNRTGLLTLSKYPIKKKSFTSYVVVKDKDWYECLIYRGTLRTEIQYGKKRIIIYNTHLRSPLSNGKTRSSTQLSELLGRVKGKNAFIVGDFNLKRDETLPATRKKWVILSASDRITNNKRNYYARVRVNRFQKASKIFDFIFATKQTPVHAHEKKMITAPLVSDHYALFTACELKARQKRKAAQPAVQHIVQKTEQQEELSPVESAPQTI